MANSNENIHAGETATAGDTAQKQVMVGDVPLASLPKECLRPDGKPLKPSVLDAEDIGQMVPFLGRHQRLTRWLIHWLKLDKVNKLHADNIKTPGPGFVRGNLHDLDITVRAENGEVLRNLPEGAFVTVSNHHFGALDGIILVDLIARRRPRY